MPMRRVGRVGKLWLKVRREWLQLHPPDHSGFYQCAICGRYVRAEEMELDHIKSRSRAPELRYALDNLQPVHHTCNQSKGSA